MSRPQVPARRHLLLVVTLLCVVAALLCSCASIPPEKRVHSASDAASRWALPSATTSNRRPSFEPRLVSVSSPDVPFDQAPHFNVDVSKLGRSALLVVSLDASYSPPVPLQRLLPPEGFRDVEGSYAVARVDPAGGRYRFNLNPMYLGMFGKTTSSPYRFVGWRVSAMVVNAVRVESVIGPKSRDGRLEPPAYLTAPQLTKKGPVMLVTEMARTKPEDQSFLKDPAFFVVPGLKGDFGTEGGMRTNIPNGEVVDEVQFDHK